MTIKPILNTWAVTLVALASAAGVWSAGAGTALAPEQAELTSTLQTTSASAVWHLTRTSTTAYFLSSTNWTYNPSLPVGAPCSSTANRPAGSVLTQVVQAFGNYRRCQ